jgi:hypothetical protein
VTETPPYARNGSFAAWIRLSLRIKATEAFYYVTPPEKIHAKHIEEHCGCSTRA